MSKIEKVKNLVYQEFSNCEKYGIEPTRLLEAFMTVSYYLVQVKKERVIEIEDGDVIFKVLKNKIQIFDITGTVPKLIATFKIH